MLHVASPEEVRQLLMRKFGHLQCHSQVLALPQGLGRVLAGPVFALQDVPGFRRSTVDGFALRAADTFGCSESLPSILHLVGEVHMGLDSAHSCEKGQCVAVPTGGHVPDGADAVVMHEYTEDYGDGSIGVTKALPPGQNMVFPCDDVAAGQEVLAKGTRLFAAHIGALAALGVCQISLAKPPLVGILSTGDELVPYNATPAMGQVRDVNAALLEACVAQCGGSARLYGICQDQEPVLENTLARMAAECDMVLVSGGSSAGAKDAVQRLVQKLGTLHLHGIAIKPGKPTIVGEIDAKPFFGLPGHPVAAYFVYSLFVAPLLRHIQGETALLPTPCYRARLAQAIASNHGREEYVAVWLKSSESGIIAQPIISKSGLITQLARADGYLQVPRNCEGLAKGEEVNVWPIGG